MAIWGYSGGYSGGIAGGIVAISACAVAKGQAYLLSNRLYCLLTI